MVEHGAGEIINIPTDHVHTCGWPDPVDHTDAPLCPWRGERRTTGWVYLDLYDASKWALNGLTQSWAKMLRPHGIRVNNVCIGATDSAMQRRFFGYGYQPGTEPPPELLSWWNDPDQVANVVLELLAEGTAGRSGDNIGIWLGHPTVLPPPSPILDVRPDFDITKLADLTQPPG
jgi:NAD(P)-dependent dehydrogenase (short-subunit alcohol dehydrogenase family)